MINHHSSDYPLQQCKSIITAVQNHHLILCLHCRNKPFVRIFLVSKSFKIFIISSAALGKLIRQASFNDYATLSQRVCHHNAMISQCFYKDQATLLLSVCNDLSRIINIFCNDFAMIIQHFCNEFPTILQFFCNYYITLLQ